MGGAILLGADHLFEAVEGPQPRLAGGGGGEVAAGGSPPRPCATHEGALKALGTGMASGGGAPKSGEGGRPTQTPRRRACYRCWETAHTIAACTVPENVKCTKCGKTGHKVKACYKK